MDMRLVTSSNIRAIGFQLNTPAYEAIAAARGEKRDDDFAPRGMVDVEFLNGSIYRYFDVPAARHQVVMLAAAPGASGPSVGQTFDSVIKKGGYRFEKLRDAVPPACKPIGEQLGAAVKS